MKTSTVVAVSASRGFALGVACALLIPGISSLQAGGPIWLCDTGLPLVWPAAGADIPWNPDQGNLGPLSHADAVALVQSAFEVWETVPSATPTFLNAGELPVDVTIDNFAPYLSPVAPDGFSAIVFDDTGEIFELLFGPDSGILGFAGPEWLDPSTCEVLEGVCFLNGPAFTDTTYAMDVMVHEFGHYVGLAHTVVNGQLGLGDTSGPTPHNTFGDPDFSLDIVETMYPFYFGPGIGMSSLEADDVAAVSTLYPEPDYPATTGTIAGTILATDGATPLTGVNVIARNLANPFEDAVSAISGNFSAFDGDPLTGAYTLNGLTPGAEYAVFVDQVFAGGFSTPLISLPGPEEFYNGANEGNHHSTDDPSEYTAVVPEAGAPVTAVNVILNAFEPGDALPVLDDGSVELPLPFPFAICQETYRSVWVNANGNVTFGEPDGSPWPAVLDFLGGPPRVAGLWTDLNPLAGGVVTFSQTPELFCVIWDRVPEFPEVGAVSLKIKLYRTGNRIDVEYGAVSAQAGIAGVSCGGCGTSGSETPSDLSVAVARRSRMGLLRQPAIFEEFGTSPFDLAGKTALYQATVNYNDNWAGANNSFASAKTVALPFSSAPMARYTEIEPVGGDVDYFRFHVEAGHLIEAEVVQGCLDSLLGLFSPTGELLMADDDGGVNLLSRISYLAPETGDYVLAVSAYEDPEFVGAGSSGGRYVLDLKTKFCPGPGSLVPSPENWLVNGSFETGDFTGWVAIDTDTPFVPWNVATDSASGWFGPIVPQDGCFVASNGFDGAGPMLSVLYQDLAIPPGEPFLTLEWKDRLAWDLLNYGPPSWSRIYAVLVFDSVTGDLLRVVSFLDTGIGTVEDTAWVDHSYDLSEFIGQSITLMFYQEIPEPSTGPGQFELDAVKLRSQ